MNRRAALLVLLALAACRRDDARGPITVSVIGRPLSAATVPGDPPAAVLALATRQGLLRFDAQGQIAPGVAERWSVSDDGRTLLFRLGGAARSEEVARAVRTAADPGGDNPLRALLGAIVEVDAVTPQVVDVELRAPRPNLLQLFAQPPLALARGGGPFRIVGRQDGAIRLRRLLPAEMDDSGDTPAPPETLWLRGERAGTAVARFRAGRAALVTGGSFDDLSIARAAALPAAALRFDPAPGLFGLAFAANDGGFTADAVHRRALAMAIDRDRIARLLAVPGWRTMTAIVASGLPEIATPAEPDWVALPLDRRRAEAAATIAALPHPPPPLRVAMPSGPGARLLFAAIRADWRAIGLDAVAVAPDAAADLLLVDEVAPTDSAAFYLRRFACDRGVPCTAEADRVLIAAREAGSLGERSALLAQADAMIAATVPFVAIGTPVRWSLVAATLDRYRDSPRAIHPLDELRTQR